MFRLSPGSFTRHLWQPSGVLLSSSLMKMGLTPLQQTLMQQTLMQQTLMLVGAHRNYMV